MKLKQVLIEGPISYRGAGGERYAAWEEPDDDGYDEAPAIEKVVNVPMTLSDGTTLGSKVAISYSEEQARNGKTYIEVHSVEVQSIILPTGQEIEPEVAVQQLGADELGTEGVYYDVDHYLGTMFKGAKVEFDMKAVTPIEGGAAPAQAASPAPAAVATPTAA